MLKVDLHTHSVGSIDGGLRAEDYRRMLQVGGLDAIAVTDHNSIDFAEKLHAELGDKVIVGEEIKAEEGEIIGLYLKTSVTSGLSAIETVKAIHHQGGLVYIPHPFETVRRGCLSEAVLNSIVGQVDIVEVHNGRAILQRGTGRARQWAKVNHKATAASSDAHGPSGWGKSYTLVARAPSRANLIEQLQTASHRSGFIGLHGALYPKMNRLKRRRRSV